MDTLEQLAYVAEGARQLELRTSHKMFVPAFYPVANLIAVLMIAAGVAELLGGALYRPYKAVLCKRCRTTVLARKAYLSLRCPNGGHRAVTTRAGWLLGVLVSLVLLLGIAVIAAQCDGLPP
jgi:hypothetical protein